MKIQELRGNLSIFHRLVAVMTEVSVTCGVSCQGRGALCHKFMSAYGSQAPPTGYYGQQPPQNGGYYGQQPPQNGGYYGQQPPQNGGYYNQQPPQNGGYYNQQPPQPAPSYSYQQEEQKETKPQQYEKSDMIDEYKINSNPKYNDLWAAILFLLCLISFAVLGYFGINDIKNYLIADGNAKSKAISEIIGISFAIAIGSGFLITVAYFFLMQRCGVYE